MQIFFTPAHFTCYNGKNERGMAWAPASTNSSATMTRCARFCASSPTAVTTRRHSRSVSDRARAALRTTGRAYASVCRGRCCSPHGRHAVRSTACAAIPISSPATSSRVPIRSRRSRDGRSPRSSFSSRRSPPQRNRCAKRACPCVRSAADQRATGRVCAEGQPCNRVSPVG